MDKIIERGLLFDFYGELLTQHQQRIYSDAVFNDLSLSELSESEGISRQGVHDLIKRCDKQLTAYENKLHLIEKFQRIKKEANKISDIISSDNNLECSAKREIQDLLKNILEDL